MESYKGCEDWEPICYSNSKEPFKCLSCKIDIHANTLHYQHLATSMRCGCAFAAGVEDKAEANLSLFPLLLFRLILCSDCFYISFRIADIANSKGRITVERNLRRGKNTKPANKS